MTLPAHIAESESIEIAMGIVLAVIDMARAFHPPESVSAREALSRYADSVEAAGQREFGADRWRAFVAHVRGRSCGGGSA